MQIAETVTFGGSGLDRAAQWRGSTDEMARLAADPAAGVLPVWRGKPLIRSGTAPGWIAPGDPALGAAGPLVFLGLDGPAPRFAADLSAWQPDTLPETLGAFHDPSVQAHPALPNDHVFAELRGVMTALDARGAELAATAKALLDWHAAHGFCARCGGETRMIEAGWQRQCRVCEARHFPRADPVVIMLITHGNDVLVGRSPGWPDGMYSLLAGYVEPGETIEAAVRRETFEEAGIRVGEVGYLASQPWPWPSSLMLGCKGRALSREITVDPIEIDDAIWVGREEMMQAISGQHPALKPARRGAIAHFLLTHWLADRLD